MTTQPQPQYEPQRPPTPGTMISRPASPQDTSQGVYLPPTFPPMVQEAPMTASLPPEVAPPVESTPSVPAPAAAPPRVPADLSFGDHRTKARKPVIVDLVGVRYAVTPPKMRSAVKMFQQLQTAAADAEENPTAAFEQHDAWIRRLFRERADEVIARMEDEDDELDMVHINQLTQALMERAAGADPTTSPSA